MTKSRYLRHLIAVFAAVGCTSSPVEVPAVEARLEEGGCISLAPGVSVEQGPAQADPAREEPVHFVVTFDMPVSGFDASDLIIGGNGGRAASADIVSRDGRVYDVYLSGLSKNGKLSLSVRSAAAEADQLCNNLSAASTSVDNVVLFLGKSR